MKTNLWTMSCALGLCAACPAVFATDYTALAGGGGGAAFDLDCGANMALIGIQGKAGSLIDSVQGVCAQFNADGSLLGGTRLTGRAGGAGGVGYELRCSGGTTVKGISGHADSYVNNLKLHCSGTTPEFTESAGNPSTTGPGPWFGLACPAGADARLVRGRAGIWVDAVGLGCKPAERLKVGTLSAPGQVRLGQTAPLTVTMSLVPVEEIHVGLTSSHASLVPSPAVVAVGTTTTTATASVPATTIGCARLTATYKGSSASADMVVHSAASPNLAVRGPTTIQRYGAAATLTVAVPAPSPQRIQIDLSVGGTVSGGSGPAASLSTTVVSIAPNTLSTTFQVTPKHLGCAPIQVKLGSVGGAAVVHTIMVVE